MPQIFKNKLVGILVISLFLLLGLNMLFSKQTPTNASDLTPGNIIKAINKERSLRNLTILNTDVRLSRAAQIKATDIIKRNYFAHINPDGYYIWPTIVAQGYTPYLQLGENLAVDFYNTESLVAAWVNSPTHRANLLNEGFEDQGMGVDFGDANSSGYYSSITNAFGTLIKSKPTPPPPPPPPAPKLQKEKPKPQVNSVIPEEKTTNQKPKTQSESIPKQQKKINTQEKKNEIALRGKDVAGEPSFTTEKNIEAPDTRATSEQAINLKPLNLTVNSNKLNRYLVLAFGAVILFALIADVRELWQKKLLPLDKKVNNIIVLILVIIIIALLYWL